MFSGGPYKWQCRKPTNTARLHHMCATKNLHGLFTWGHPTESCSLRVTSCGKTLPAPFCVSDTTNNSVLFCVDRQYVGEIVEISLENLTGFSGHYEDAVFIVCTRENSRCHRKITNSLFRSNRAEHSVAIFCLQGDERLHIEYQRRGQPPKLMMVVEFMFSDNPSK